MIDTFKNLLKVKSLVTLALTASFVYLSVIGMINAEQFMTIFTVVIGFYFGTQAQKKIDETSNETKVETLEIDEAGVCPVCGHSSDEVFTKNEVDAMLANTESFEYEKD